MRRDAEDELWACLYFDCSENIEEFARWTFTRDEHEMGQASIKAFPSRKAEPYIWEILDQVQSNQLVAVEKSRQMMLTWCLCLYVLWDCKFHERRAWFIQSKKLEDACALIYCQDPAIGRISFMESSLCEELRTVDFDKDASYGKIFFQETGSVLQGIPEGGDMIRQYTASGIFCDEAGFQPEFEAAYNAARPTLSSGGKMLVVTTPSPGAYAETLFSR